MRIPGKKTIFPIAPPFYGNDKLKMDDEIEANRPFVLHLSGITAADADAAEQSRQEMAGQNSGSDLIEMIQQDELALFERHFHGADRLIIGDADGNDVEIKTAEQFIDLAPLDLQSWAKRIIKSTETLIEKEIKN